MSTKNNSLIHMGTKVSAEEKSSKIQRNQSQFTLCNLPEHAVGHIFTRLNWVDRVRFCAASKLFSSLLHNIHIPCQPTDKLPWLLFFSSRGTTDDNGETLVTIELSDPSSKRNYRFKIMEQEAKEHLLGAKICSSNHGWVLLSRKASTINGMYHRCFSLYTPFGNKFIKLPELGSHNYDYRGDKVTFSMDPNSLRCVFNIWYDKLRRAVNINMCRIDDDSNSNWKKLEFVLPANVMITVIQHVTYADGSVYCVFDEGRELGIFDVVLQEWKFFWDCMPPLDDLVPPLKLQFYRLVAFNGELFLYGNLFLNKVSFLWRFDKSLKQWVHQESLGNLALFVLYPAILLVEAVGEFSSYANTIHLLDFSEIKYMMFSGGSLAEYVSSRRGIGKLKKSVLYSYHSPSHYDDSMEYCWIQPHHLFTRN